MLKLFTVTLLLLSCTGCGTLKPLVTKNDLCVVLAPVQVTEAMTAQQVSNAHKLNVWITSNCL